VATPVKPDSMTDVLGLYVKDVIAAYPTVGDILARSSIGCVTCSVGTCLLKDVVGIHNLTEEQEHALFAAIAGVIFRGRTMALPITERKAAPTNTRKLSPPLHELVDEHTNIKRALALLPVFAELIRRELDSNLATDVALAIEFVRQYADKFHHAKEEDILFTYFDAQSDILKVMHKEHEIGRQHVRSALAALEMGNATGVIEHLSAYGALLTEHIKKEDEILYPWMNSQLTDSQVGRLFTKFEAVNEQFGARVRVQLGRVEELEMGYTPKRRNSQ